MLPGLAPMSSPRDVHISYSGQWTAAAVCGFVVKLVSELERASFLGRDGSFPLLYFRVFALCVCCCEVVRMWCVVVFSVSCFCLAVVVQVSGHVPVAS